MSVSSLHSRKSSSRSADVQPAATVSIPPALDDFSALGDLNRDYTCPCDESKMYDQFDVPERSEGMWVWFLKEPEPYLDLVLGYGSLNFGHGNSSIVEAAQESLRGISQIHSFHNRAQIVLSKFLADRLAPGEPYRVYFDVGGSSVVEAALRLCRAAAGRDTIIAFSGAFHGTGFAASAVTDPRFIDPAQYGSNPLGDAVVRLPFPGPAGPDVGECLELLEDSLASRQPACAIIEPIQGANGFVIPPDDFLPAVRELTARHGVPLIADEIQMGVGRAGHLYSIQQWGVTPDIALLSKSLGGGIYPLSAIIARAEFFDNVPVRATAFQSTFNNNPFGCQVALRALQYAEDEALYENASKEGVALLRELDFLNEVPWIRHLRGLGLAIAFDFVSKDGSESPRPDFARTFVEVALEERVLLYRSGTHRNRIKLAPPLNLTAEGRWAICRKMLACMERFRRRIRDTGIL
jgi:4-aminobutyrate aminotransferase/(S)-3-amino-2-methylpropionate transaminase